MKFYQIKDQRINLDNVVSYGPATHSINNTDYYYIRFCYAGSGTEHSGPTWEICLGSEQTERDRQLKLLDQHVQI